MALNKLIYCLWALVSKYCRTTERDISASSKNNLYIVPKSATNRAQHERYKNELRAAMQRPAVSNKTLCTIVDKLQRPNVKPGNASVAAVVRQELSSGRPVGCAYHTIKASDGIAELRQWLIRNPTSKPGDRAAAENLIIDLSNALRGR